MTDSCRKEIISSLAIQMFQYTIYPTSEEYTTVCCGWLISTLSLLTRLVMELRVHLLDVVNCTNYLPNCFRVRGKSNFVGKSKT